MVIVMEMAGIGVPVICESKGKTAGKYFLLE